jgi:hypothetical protein
LFTEQALVTHEVTYHISSQCGFLWFPLVTFTISVYNLCNAIWLFVAYVFVLVCNNPELWVVKSRRMRWAGHVARMGEDRGVHRVLVGKPEGKRPLGRPRRRWEDNIKMDL